MQALSQIIKSKSFSSLIGNGLGAILGVITFAILARVLPKDVFGSYLIFLAIYGVFETLRIGMVMNALVRNLAQCNSVEEENIVIGSTLFITFFLTFIFLALTTVLYFFFSYLGILIPYLYFFKWLMLIALISAPNNFATWYLNAKLKIVEMSAIRIITQLVFLFITWFYLQQTESVPAVILCLAVSHLLASLLAVIMGWSGIKYLFSYSKEKMLEVFHFGKFSMGTLIGANLLRSSDSFIIGSSFLGGAGVALFNVPARLIEVIEVPLRSFAVTALPQFSKLFVAKSHEELRFEFEKKSGLVFFLLLPISILCFVFADWLVFLIGGKGYEESAILLRLFATYMAILPLDKFSGVLLDTINKPNINFYKVLIQLAVNVIGDIIGLYFFGNLQSVAIVSTATFVVGVLFGYMQLNKYLGVKFSNVMRLGWFEFKTKSLSVINIK